MSDEKKSPQEGQFEFTSIPLIKIQPDAALPADVYLLINDKYIKFKEAGDSISGDKYNFFLSKSLKYFYINVDQVNDFMNWLKLEREKAIAEMVEKAGEEARTLVESREDMKEKVFETFADQELNSENLKVIQGTVEGIIEEVSQNKFAQATLAKLIKHNESIAEHSVNVANLSVFLGMVNGHGHQFVLENLYLGGIMHDYAKSKIPEHILSNPSNVLYSQAIQDHPEKGRDAVAKLPEIPEQVLTIIEQHHEQWNGQGFPRGLRAEDIYDLAQIVAMANVFDNILTENKNRPTEMYRRAIKVIEFDRGKKFNPDLIPRSLEALKFAFKEHL